MGQRVDRSVGLVQRTVLRGSFIQFALSVSMFLLVNLDALIAEPCVVSYIYIRVTGRDKTQLTTLTHEFFPNKKNTLHERLSALFSRNL